MNRKVLHTMLYVMLLALITAACGTASYNTVNATSTANTAITSQQQSTASVNQNYGPGTETGLLLRYVSKSMSALKAVHFELTAAINPGGIESSSANLSQLLHPLGGPHHLEIQGQGDAIAPNFAKPSSRISLHQKLTQDSVGSGRPFSLDEVIDQNEVYILGNDNQWYLLSRVYLLTHPENTTYLDYGMVQVQSLISLAMSKGTLNDMGNTTIGNKQLHHIRASYGKDAFDELQAIDVENYTWPLVKANSAQNPQGSTDFWLDDTTGYVYQLDNVINYGQSNNLTTFVTAKTLHFELSKFNQPITITPPSHATPIKDVNQLYTHP